MEYKNIYEVLKAAQKMVAVPDSQGRWKYKKLDDILDAVDKAADKLGFIHYTDQSNAQIGELVYTKLYFICPQFLLEKTSDSPFQHDRSWRITVGAFTRVELTKKSMDDSQASGSASTYGRRTCYKQLFNLEGEAKEDPDSIEAHNEELKAVEKFKVESEAKAKAKAKAYAPLKDMLMSATTLDDLDAAYQTVMSHKDYPLVCKQADKRYDVQKDQLS